MLHCISWLLCRMPLGWAMAVARGIAWVWYYLVPIRRQVALDNVARALGPDVSVARRRHIVRQSFLNICMYAVEELRMPKMTPAESAERVAREHIERIDALLARGRGVVAVTAHVGNFELLGSSQTIRGYPISAILKDIAWPSAQRFWRQVRAVTQLGQIAPRNSKDTIVAALGRNEIVAFLVDQHMARHRAIVCRFFGQWAATSPAPVRFALATGAPILPLFITRTQRPGYHVIHFGEEFQLETISPDPAHNLRHNTQRLNDIIEGWIRAHPEQWLWMHKRWKVHDDPAGWDVPAGPARTPP